MKRLTQEEITELIPSFSGSKQNTLLVMTERYNQEGDRCLQGRRETKGQMKAGVQAPDFSVKWGVALTSQQTAVGGKDPQTQTDL